MLDTYLVSYNEQRLHPSYNEQRLHPLRRIQGRTPPRAFLDGRVDLPIVNEETQHLNIDIQPIAARTSNHERRCQAIAVLLRWW